jgi:hypothetical protein
MGKRAQRFPRGVMPKLLEGSSDDKLTVEFEPHPEYSLDINLNGAGSENFEHRIIHIWEVTDVEPKIRSKM